MTDWIVLAPERADDDALKVTAWIARETIALAARAPISLIGSDAVRTEFERAVATTAGLGGVAFFGHGKPDRLFDADRPPEAPAPALIDEANVALLRGCWVHALACWSGATLATRAVLLGAVIYVGYREPLDVGFDVPTPAPAEFRDLVTCVTLSLLLGERDERALLRRVSDAADRFLQAIQDRPDDAPGLIWYSLFAQQLVDYLVVVLRQ